MKKDNIEQPPKTDVAEVPEVSSPRELLARGAVLFGSACLAVGGAIGYAIGLLDGMRQRKEDRP
jgi:hypothetical protein